MPIALLLLLPLDPTPAERADRLVAGARDLTRAEYQCQRAEDATTITVCGLRDADRYRVPLAVVDYNDPRHEGVHQQTSRLLDPHTNKCGITGPFLQGCGMAGVNMTVQGGKTRVSTQRDLAP